MPPPPPLPELPEAPPPPEFHISTRSEEAAEGAALFAVKAPWGDGDARPPDRQDEVDAWPTLRVPAFETRAVGSYMTPCILCVGGSSALTVVLWSAMGAGEEVLGLLQENYHWRLVYLSSALAVFLGLYLLDFFWPPHIPGRVWALWEGDRAVGSSVCAFGMVLILIYFVLLAREHPSLPMFSTILLSPFLLYIYRFSTGKRRQLPPDKYEVAERGSEEEKAQLLGLLDRRHRDKASYLYACFVCFILSFVGCLLVFLAWLATDSTAGDDVYARDIYGDGSHQQEAKYALWSAPLVVAVANALLGLVLLFRILTHEYYMLTDHLRQCLEGLDSPWPATSGQQAELPPSDLADKPGGTNTKSGCSLSGTNTPVTRVSYIRSESGRKQDIAMLMLMLKVTAFTIFLMLGCLYFIFTMLYADSGVAALAQNFLIVFFVIFLVFAHVAFRRIVDAVGKSLAELPLWRAARGIMQSDWTRAMITCAFLTAAPLIFALSSLNQCVRRRRGIAPMCEPRRWNMLTPRVGEVLSAMEEDWDRLGIIFKCHALCFAYLLLKLTPVLLNAWLAWMETFLKDNFGYWVIVILVLAIGVVAFMLPPVPGMTVYIFGGLVLSNPATCPYGFWGGTAINIALSWFLKHAASALQQKVIGEALGRRLWVRQLAGVHKEPIRCLESILRRPGLSVGKVAILCGGPDWPVSVLCGILRLDLLQCMVGTTPIIFFVTPCALSGSFYLQQAIADEASRAFWSRTASTMLVVAVGMSAMLFAVIGWSVERELATNHKELSRKLPENADLEWLDHQAEEVRRACRVSWEQVPPCVRRLLIAGVATQILVCNAFVAFSGSLLGDFQVYDGLANLRWYSEEGGDGIFTSYSLAALGSYSLAWLCPVPYMLWRRRTTKTPRQERMAQLAVQKQAWMAEYLREAGAAEARARLLKGDESKALASAGAGEFGAQLQAGRRPSPAAAAVGQAGGPCHGDALVQIPPSPVDVSRRHRHRERTCGSRESRLPEDQASPGRHFSILAAQPSPAPALPPPPSSLAARGRRGSEDPAHEEVGWYIKEGLPMVTL